MSDHFAAQTLLETRASGDERRFELTFVDSAGAKQTISMPRSVAAELAPVLASLAPTGNAAGGREFTKVPKLFAVGRARHEPLVLLRFDDDPPYGLDLEEARRLCREVREEVQVASRRKTTTLQ
jgi:hypothetical protein